MWYQSGSRRDKECDLFEPLFKTPSNKKDNNSFNLKPLLSEMVRPGTPIETKLIGYYNVRDNEEEKAKVLEQYSKNQQIFLTFENEDNKVEIILTRDKNIFDNSQCDLIIYSIGCWYEENKYIWDSTNELGEANCWLINHINCYDCVKIYRGEYNKNNLI